MRDVQEMVDVDPKWSMVLILLLLFGSFMVFPSSVVCEGEAGDSLDSNRLLQYEWPWIHGDPGFTRFSEGPAPESPDILWKTGVEGIQSYIAAFDGKVFVTTSTDVLALDKDCGSIVWNTTLPSVQRWPAVFKIDEKRLVIGSHCLEIETGRILWVSEDFSAKVSYWAEGVYSPQEEMFYVQDTSVVQGWNFSDPSEPPVLEWETYISGSTSAGTGIQYGDGRVFPGSFEPYQMALNATTGDILWETETTGAMCFSGSYYEGKLLKAGEQDNTFYCFDAETGDILWEYHPGTQLGYWVSGSAAAYGMVYGLNKDGHLYALDVESGELMWKYEGPGYMFWPGWPVVGDGKVYATTGQRVSYHPHTLEYSESEFVCLDAFTGKPVWKLPIEAHPPRESTALAYGNLYLIPGYIEENKMDSYETLDEVWAIGRKSWGVWRGDSGNRGAGGSGPTEFNLRWKFTADGGVTSTPVIADGKVYVGSQDRNIYSLDARDGRLLWNFSIDARVKSSPAVVDNRVYIGPDDGYVYSLDAEDGSFQWKTYAGGEVEAPFKAVTGIRSSPTVVADKVYVGSLDSHLYCLDVDSGDIVWRYNTTGYITSSPAVVDGEVYLTSQEPSAGTLYKLNASDGSSIWEYEIPYVLTGDRGTDLHSSPVVGDGMVFVAANKDVYYGVNATTGETEWSYVTLRGTEDLGGYLVASPAYHNGTLFIVDMFFITALEGHSGEVMWRSWIGTELYTSPTYADGKIYVTTDRRFVYILNATDGERLSSFELNSNSWSAPSLYEGRLYFGSNDWNVYCLDEVPVTRGQIHGELSREEVEEGETISLCGQLTPKIGKTPITVSVENPDGEVDSLQVISENDGAFTVHCTPDLIGEWTVSLHCSGATYIMESKEISFNVVEPPSLTSSQPSSIPLSDVFLVVGVVFVTLIGATAYAVFKKKR